VIDLGPEAGDGGGRVVVEGTPEEIVECGVRNAECKTPKKKKRTAARQSAVGEPQSSFISHTAQALAPVLVAGPHVERKDTSAALAESRQGDMDIADVGRDTKMPWEIDGPRWHTRERVARDGRPVRWDGRIVAEIVRRIHELGDFSPTNWNSRSVVEISATKKTDGWFFHAITGERWLVKLKFRTAKKTFQRDPLLQELGLKPLNDLPEIEAYGSGPRIKCKNLRGPWQEVQIDAHSWQEVNTPAFWSFLECAVEGFERFTNRIQKSPDDVMPWKVLGQKWHLARKGFPPGKKVAWQLDVLEDLLEMLEEASPGGQFLWNNQQVVHRMISGSRDPWASVYTKRLAGVDLVLHGPEGLFPLGRIAELGADRSLAGDSSGGRDQLRFRFVTTDDLERGGLTAFLDEHIEATRSVAVGES
jgi:excinuclease ABC subunit A